MPETETTWLTPAAHSKLVEELDQLTTTGRKEVTERIAEARSHGDIRENADYDAAKNEQGMMEARIRQIQHILDTAEVREAAATDSVEVGSIVEIERGDGTTMEVFVAPRENKVDDFVLASPTSPLGAALLGHAPGDEVEYSAPSGPTKVKVLSIRPFEG
jgi:transcription elongation factor GreA